MLSRRDAADDLAPRRPHPNDKYGHVIDYRFLFRLPRYSSSKPDDADRPFAEVAD
jgi:hypothetical protein